MVEAKYRTKVSSKGQIVIPKDIREKHGYRKGSKLIITALDENRILLERVPRLSEIFGFMGGAEATKTLLTERERESSVEKEREKELGQ